MKWADYPHPALVSYGNDTKVVATSSFTRPKQPLDVKADSKTRLVERPVTRGSALTRLASKKPKNNKSNKMPKKEKGWAPTIKKHVGTAASWAWDFLVKRIFGSTRAVLEEKAMLTKLASTKNEKDYVAIFNNDLPAKIRLCDDQISVLRSEMAAALATAGMRTLKITLPRALDAYRIATVTSGVVNNIVTILPNDPTEFASAVALFEEYKMTGLTIISNNFLLTPTTGVQTLNNSMNISVADPAEGASAFTSVLQGAQYQQQQLNANGAGYPTAGADNGAERGLSKWNISFPRGMQYDNDGANMYAAQDEWLPSNAAVTSPPKYCWIKHYTVQAVTTANNVSSALMYYHLEFRSRQ